MRSSDACCPTSGLLGASTPCGRAVVETRAGVHSTTIGITALQEVYHGRTGTVHMFCCHRAYDRNFCHAWATSDRRSAQGQGSSVRQVILFMVGVLREGTRLIKSFWVSAWVSWAVHTLCCTISGDVQYYDFCRRPTRNSMRNHGSPRCPAGFQYQPVEFRECPPGPMTSREIPRHPKEKNKILRNLPRGPAGIPCIFHISLGSPRNIPRGIPMVTQGTPRFVYQCINGA